MLKLLSTLDLWRAQWLKLGLKNQSLNYLFFNRSLRVFLLFSMALAVYLIAALFVPLWVLLVGPILWGVPHLVSSLRYSTNNLKITKKLSVQKTHLLLWLFVFIYRFFNDVIEYPLPLSQFPLLVEGLALLTATLVQIYFVKQNFFKNLLSLFFVGGLLLCTYFYPINTALVVLIGHNYLPLYYWWQSCHTNSDKKIFAISSALFLLASLAIYFGWFMGLYSMVSPQGQITFLNWDYSEVISPFVTENYNYEFWFRIVSLYAFSQAIHYFIWLKAIPENHQKQKHPPSFKTSWLNLQGEFGAGSVEVFVVFCLIGLALWGFLEFQSARTFYFSLASYHGFMELSAIGFLKKDNFINEQHHD